MVYGTILSHGGAVTLESVPGDGTSVFLLLPATDAAPDAPADLAVSTEETQDVGGLVLLVEDESLLRHVGRKMLEKLGFSVVEAENGVSGVEAFKEHGSEIALVILDLVMPEMDGAEAFAELKKIDPDVAVLISSGFTDDEVVEELLANGAVGFVEKPFDLNSLREAVAAALSGRPSSPH
jgi:CheY-like chemotaxis protein